MKDTKTHAPTPAPPLDKILSGIALRIRWDDVQSVQHGDRTPFLDAMRRLASAPTPAPEPTLKEELEDAIRARKHTQDWYARHYGKLQDWARKRLPEPWRTEFFHCVANGTWGFDDVGESYMSMVGKITPSGYFVMDDAYKQLLSDQTVRAEIAEGKLAAPAAAQGAPDGWISPREKLPDEDEWVLVAVRCESEDHDGVTQRWAEVHESTLYSARNTIYAATADDGEFEDDEILGWMALPSAPSLPSSPVSRKED